MTKDEMLYTLYDLRGKYHVLCEGCESPEDYYDEKEEVIDRWNSLVSEAVLLGISHKELNEIWHEGL